MTATDAIPEPIDEEPTVPVPQHWTGCCGARITMAELCGATDHVCSSPGIYGAEIARER